MAKKIKLKKVVNNKEISFKASTDALKSVKTPSLGWVERARQFLREVKVELKKVTWPSKRELIGSTIVVIVFVFIVAAYLGLIDFIYTAIIGKLLG
jgi:preprotein translocase subunit SecE